MKKINESINFNSIDKIISLSFNDINKIKDFEFDNETKTFIEKIINKYNKYARDNSFNINTTIDEYKSIFEFLLELFPDNQSKFYNDIKSAIETKNYQLFFDDKWKLQSCKNIQLNYDN